MDRPVRVYCEGIWDLFHVGHARCMMQAKNVFPNVYLLVGISDEESTHDIKGITVNTENERINIVRHCRYVDEIVTGRKIRITPEFLEKHHIDFVAHDALPYITKHGDFYQWMKDAGRFVATERTEGISTTDLITRVVEHHNAYCDRNESRGVELDCARLDEKTSDVSKTAVASKQTQ